MRPGTLHERDRPASLRRMRGLYVITRPQPDGAEGLVRIAEAAVAGGARVVQYRDKGNDHDRRRAEAGALMEMCRRRGAIFIVNDDIALAAGVGADGVHLGAGDPALAEAREQLAPHGLIGASCYDRLERALDAQAQGAAYVAFGSFFASPTKPEAVRADPGLLRRARSRLHVPICAIGGITPENGAELVRGGADMLAVLSGVFDADDPRAAAAAYARLFDRVE